MCLPLFRSYCLFCWKAYFLQIKAALSCWTVHVFYSGRKGFIKIRSNTQFAKYCLKITKFKKMSKYAKTMSQLHAVENYLTNLANTAFKWAGILGFQSIILWIGGQVLENKRGVEVALPLLSWASTKYAFRGGEPCHTLRPQNCSQITCVFKVCVHEAPGLGAFAWSIGEQDRYSFSLSRAHSLAGKEILNQSLQQWAEICRGSSLCCGESSIIGT